MKIGKLNINELRSILHSNELNSFEICLLEDLIESYEVMAEVLARYELQWRVNK